VHSVYFTEILCFTEILWFTGIPSIIGPATGISRSLQETVDIPKAAVYSNRRPEAVSLPDLGCHTPER